MYDETISRLLSTDNPSAWYHALRDIVGKREHRAVVRASRLKIRNSKIANEVFKRQKLQGYWEDIVSPYLPKYSASYRQLMILAQLGMDNGNARIKSACNHVFDFQHAEGGFCSDTPVTALRVLRRVGRYP